MRRRLAYLHQTDFVTSATTRMRSSDVLACSFPAWYDTFAKVTFKSVVVDLQPEVLEYLRSEGSLVLPKECDGEWAKNDDRNEDDDDDDATDWTEDDEDDAAERPSFPQFAADVRRAMSSLGGDVFCKLNWSSPRDATWVSFGNSLRCSDLKQVLLLLKSSDFVRHDLTRPFEHCEDAQAATEAPVRYCLVLRRWAEINPANEFRCFVRRGRLAAVTQRDATGRFDYIAQQRDSVLRDVATFFAEYVEGRFGPDDFVFDVVRSAKDRVSLVDFGPFGPTTDPVLFTWEELEASEDADEVDFRFVQDDAGIQPNGLRQYSVPVDMVDLAAGRDPDKLIDFLRLQEQQQQGQRQQEQERRNGGDDGLCRQADGPT